MTHQEIVDKVNSLLAEEFEVDEAADAYRYIRVRVLETWGVYGSWGNYEASSFIFINELTFYGTEEE